MADADAARRSGYGIGVDDSEFAAPDMSGAFGAMWEGTADNRVNLTNFGAGGLTAGFDGVIDEDIFDKYMPMTAEGEQVLYEPSFYVSPDLVGTPMQHPIMEALEIARNNLELGIVDAQQTESSVLVALARGGVPVGERTQIARTIMNEYRNRIVRAQAAEQYGAAARAGARAAGHRPLDAPATRGSGPNRSGRNRDVDTLQRTVPRRNSADPTWYQSYLNDQETQR